MAKIARETQLLFGSTAPSTQIGQFGSLQAGTPTTTTNIATIQALSNYLGGWYQAVVVGPNGPNSPALEDWNALCYLFAYQLGYLLQEGIPEWDPGTTYYTSSLVNFPVWVFTITSGSATVGATYINNAQTFTVVNTISSATTIIMVGTGAPTASGTLTKVSGTGGATLSFSANSSFASVYQSLIDSNLNNPLGTTADWIPGSVQPNSSLTSLTIPSGYNYSAGFVTIQASDTYTITGTAILQGTTTVLGNLTITGTVLC